jgi:hypothetical protein
MCTLTGAHPKHTEAEGGTAACRRRQDRGWGMLFNILHQNIIPAAEGIAISQANFGVEDSELDKAVTESGAQRYILEIHLLDTSGLLKETCSKVLVRFPKTTAVCWKFCKLCGEILSWTYNVLVGQLLPIRQPKKGMLENMRSYSQYFAIPISQCSCVEVLL